MVEKLFNSFLIKGIGECKNRVVMAPLTRLRADPKTGVLPDYSVDYYKERADAGLIIVEATNISGPAGATAGAPGIWSDDQVHQWRKINDAIHASAGRVVCQLSHAGMIRQTYLPGDESADSTKSQEQMTFIPLEEMTVEQIQSTVQKYADATRNAARAGFDGVEIRAANGFLPFEFMSIKSNRRKDKYSCASFENRLRFLMEILEACRGAAWESDRDSHVGIRLSPTATFDTATTNSDPFAFTKRLFADLNKHGVAYVHFAEPEWLKFIAESRAQHADPRSDQALWNDLKALLGQTSIISSGGYDRDKATKEAGNSVDAVAFGRAFIANPDLVYRLRHDLPLAPFDSAYLYAGGEKGYTDWPRYGDSSPASTTA